MATPHLQIRPGTPAFLDLPWELAWTIGIVIVWWRCLRGSSFEQVVNTAYGRR